MVTYHGQISPLTDWVSEISLINPTGGKFSIFIGGNLKRWLHFARLPQKFPKTLLLIKQEEKGQKLQGAVPVCPLPMLVEDKVGKKENKRTTLEIGSQFQI